jgi:hypothetical protein
MQHLAAIAGILFSSNTKLRYPHSKHESPVKQDHALKVPARLDEPAVNKNVAFVQSGVFLVSGRQESQRGAGRLPFVAFWLFLRGGRFFCRLAPRRVRGVTVIGVRLLFSLQARWSVSPFRGSPTLRSLFTIILMARI